MNLMPTNLPPLWAIRAEQDKRSIDRVRNMEAKKEFGLVPFTREAWHVVEPSRPFVYGWHIGAIAEHLEAVTRGQCIRLLINVPPGMMKSLLTTVFWPAYEWGPYGAPSLRYIGYSFDTELSIRDALRCRRLITSAWYQRLWGERFSMTGDQNVKTRYENDKTGYRISDYVGGGTGDRGDRDIVDDPHNIRDGESEVKRQTALTWLHETLPSRLNDPKLSAIIIIHHRIHGQDMSGDILESDLGYEHLMLPMEYEPKRCCYTKVNNHRTPALEMKFLPSQKAWVALDETVPLNLVAEFNEATPRLVYKQDPRTEQDELIFTQRFPRDVVDRDKKAMGPYAVAGQFQQEPTPRTGGLFKAGCFEVVPAYPADCIWVRHWDLAATKGGTGAYTAGVLMGRSRGNKMFYVADVKRTRDDGDEIKKLIKSTAESDKIKYGNVRISLPQDPGQAGKVQAKDLVLMLAGFEVIAQRETGDKETRATPYANQAEAGNVKLVKGENGIWIPDYLAEVMPFPNFKWKDQVDGSSGAFGELITMPLLGAATTKPIQGMF